MPEASFDDAIKVWMLWPTFSFRLQETPVTVTWQSTFREYNQTIPHDPEPPVFFSADIEERHPGHAGSRGG